MSSDRVNLNKQFTLQKTLIFRSGHYKLKDHYESSILFFVFNIGMLNCCISVYFSKVF